MITCKCIGVYVCVCVCVRVHACVHACVCVHFHISWDVLMQ